MLSIFPRALISSALLMLLSSPAGAYDKQSAMDAAKEEATSARVEKQQMKGQAAVLKEQVRSAQANAKHYAERLQNIERDLFSTMLNQIFKLLMLQEVELLMKKHLFML